VWGEVCATDRVTLCTPSGLGGFLWLQVLYRNLLWYLLFVLWQRSKRCPLYKFGGRLGVLVSILEVTVSRKPGLVGYSFCRVISRLQCWYCGMGRKVQTWRWGVPGTNMDDTPDVLIPAHVAYCIYVSGLVSCTLEGWDLEVYTSVFLWRFALGRNFLPVFDRQARLLFLSYSLLGSGRAGLLVSFPEGRLSCMPGPALELELRVCCRVV